MKSVFKSIGIGSRRQRGIVLVSSLLLLIVMTIMAISMFRSFGLQAKIAGNLREKQRALHAAESAEQYAEWWLTFGGNAASAPVICNSLLNSNGGFGQICQNLLTTVVPNQDVSALPWRSNGTDVGVTYWPLANTSFAMLFGSPSVNGPETYYQVPRFYISDLGSSADGSIPGEIFQIDAVGYGATTDTAAVVESTYAVYLKSWNTTL